MRFFKLVRLVTLACFLSIPSISMAAPFVVTYTGTLNGSSTSPFLPGEPISISIVADNGGTSTASQTWTSADVVSVTFSMNNAPNIITTVFSPVVFDTFAGNFVTNAGGTLTAVPSDWSDTIQASTVLSTNDTMGAYTDFEWYINGGNPVYFDQGGPGPSAEIVGNSTDQVASWSAPIAYVGPNPTSVPTLTQWSMILLTLMLFAVGFVKARRFR